MIIFANRGAAHLADTIHIPKGNYTINQFSDGELYVTIESDIKGKIIWVIACTQPPAENLLELFFLLDALTHAGAQRINLFFPYFGYARQAVAFHGQAHSAQFICKAIERFPVGTIKIMHIHATATMHTLLTFDDVIDTDFFCTIAHNYDSIAATDKGVAEFAQTIAQLCNKEIILLKKVRPQPEHVSIELIEGTVAGKKILLVDDIISTGRTMIEAAQLLSNLGALEVGAAATHGIFAPGSYERLAQSPIKKIYVTNTINNQQHGIVHVSDISNYIESLIKRS